METQTVFILMNIEAILTVIAVNMTIMLIYVLVTHKSKGE